MSHKKLMTTTTVGSHITVEVVVRASGAGIGHWWNCGARLEDAAVGVIGIGTRMTNQEDAAGCRCLMSRDWPLVAALSASGAEGSACDLHMSSPLGLSPQEP